MFHIYDLLQEVVNMVKVIVNLKKINVSVCVCVCVCDLKQT